MPTVWALTQQTNLKAISGRSINAWRGIEMAFESADETEPIWRHPNVNAIQCTVVDALVGANWRRFLANAGDDPASDWGLVVEDAPAELEPTSSDTTIYRSIALEKLPCGIVSNIELETDTYGMVGGMHLDINGDSVSLYAAEVYDNGAGGFRVAEYDESILVRLNNQRPENGESGKGHHR